VSSATSQTFRPAPPAPCASNSPTPAPGWRKWAAGSWKRRSGMWKSWRS